MIHNIVEGLLANDLMHQTPVVEGIWPWYGHLMVESWIIAIVVFEGYPLIMVYCNTTNGPLCEKGDCSPLHIHVGDLVHPMVRDLRIRVKQHIKVTPTRGVRGRILSTLVGLWGEFSSWRCHFWYRLSYIEMILRSCSKRWCIVLEWSIQLNMFNFQDTYSALF